MKSMSKIGICFLLFKTHIGRDMKVANIVWGIKIRKEKELKKRESGEDD
jgi:hypothetical protein